MDFFTVVSETNTPVWEAVNRWWQHSDKMGMIQKIKNEGEG